MEYVGIVRIGLRKDCYFFATPSSPLLRMYIANIVAKANKFETICDIGSDSTAWTSRVSRCLIGFIVYRPTKLSMGVNWLNFIRRKKVVDSKGVTEAAGLLPYPRQLSYNRWFLVSLFPFIRFLLFFLLLLLFVISTFSLSLFLRAFLFGKSIGKRAISL